MFAPVRLPKRIMIFVPASLALVAVFAASAQAPSGGETSSQIVQSLSVRGNRTLTESSILNMSGLKIGETWDSDKLANALRSIYQSGFFQDVQIDKAGNGLVIAVSEKPTVVSISYNELGSSVSESSLKDKLQTKLYTIVDERKLAQDLQTIEQSYVDKGYPLAKVTYKLEEKQPGTVAVVFEIVKNTPLTVRRVNFIGNSAFSDSELQGFMATKPYSWLAFLTSAGLFRTEFTLADQQNITYFYRDNGFAEATVAAPLTRLDAEQNGLSVSFFIQEGEKFQIGKVKITGDLVESEDSIKNQLSLREGDLYQISRFNDDMQKLKTIYGDKGYAFAYVYPEFQLDREKKLYSITYQISKGEKTYFRHITILGNIKTRDNVIRRALSVSDGQLFNSSLLQESQRNIEKLGYFSSVQVLQEPDRQNSAMDIRVIVKEQSTGKLSASLGVSPNSTGGQGVTFFGQGQYQESNLLGKGYSVGLSAQISPNPQNTGKINYQFGVSFFNPSLFDGPWSFGVNGNYSYQVQSLTTSTSTLNNAYITQKSRSVGFDVGRRITENTRFSIGYSVSDTSTDPSISLTKKFYSHGKTEKISQTLSYDSTDNTLSPTEGLSAKGTNSFAFKGAWGEYRFGSLSALIAYYVPLVFGKDYKTNFRFAFQPRYVYQFSASDPVPYWERLTLGNSYFMKGYSNAGEIISPSIPVLISPVTGQTVDIPFGGNRSFYGSAEYFVPIVPEAGLRFVTFAEAGTVLDDYDSFSLDKIKYDVGFGFRWDTVFAPFRFEWAFPLQGKQVGETHFIFTIGSDSLTNSY